MPGLATALSQGREEQLPARTRSSDPAGEVKGSPDPTPHSSPILSLKRKIRKTKVGKNQKVTHFSQSPKDFLAVSVDSSPPRARIFRHWKMIAKKFSPDCGRSDKWVGASPAETGAESPALALH